MTARQATRGTEIAALEARRNEDQVRADGALLGERRVAIARFAMVAMFGLVTAFGNGHPPPHIMAIGWGYSAYASVTLIALWRMKHADVTAARWAPVVVTIIDYAFLTTQALIVTAHHGFDSGQHAIGLVIVLSFAVARRSLWHVILALACAEASFVIVALDAGLATTYPTIFVEGGLLVIGLLLAMTNRAIGQMFHGLRQRDNLTRFLPRQVAERVIAAGPGALAPVEREITVLFSDIRGFTGLSEGLAPRDVLAMLDDYFGRMAQIVKGHDGVVGKFLGDGLLAFWGVPDAIPDHATRAVRAARDMRRELVELNRHRAQGGLPPIRIGIGIHTGRVAAGMLGGELQSEYTIIGDAVNVASRIEGLTKEHGADVLISETTWGQLNDPGAASYRRIADVQIRGRKEPVVLYALDDRADVAA